MSNSQQSLLRYLIGFVCGGVVAAASAGIVFRLCITMPAEDSPSSHDTIGALILLDWMMFVSGGFIGGRGFTADFLSDLFRPIFCSYAVIGFLCLFPGWSFWEIAGMIGFATVGIVSSAIFSLLLLGWFPPKEQLEQ